MLITQLKEKETIMSLAEGKKMFHPELSGMQGSTVSRIPVKGVK
jgi:hypothetical protein